MSNERSLSYSLLTGLGALAGALLSSVILLVIELMAAFITYFYLAYYQQDLFGSLVGTAGDIFALLKGQIEFWMPSLRNALNATVVGEINAKSMLLLLIGLVVGAVIRLVLWLVARIAGAATGR